MNSTLVMFVGTYVIIVCLALTALRFFIMTLRPIPVIRFKPHRYDNSFVSLRLLEGRREGRRFMDADMACQALDGSYHRGGQFWMQSCDISNGGVGFVGDYQVPRGTPLEVKFQHRGKTISFTGKVAWTKRVRGDQFCGGLQFNPGQVPV